MAKRRTLVRAVTAVAIALLFTAVHARTTRGEVTLPPTVGSSPALGSNLPAPVPGNLDLAADLLEVDTRASTATLSGHVRLMRTDLSLACARIEAKYDAGGAKVTWVHGTGGVIADVKGVHGESPEFELDLEKQKLTLRGGVRLFRGNGWLAADGAEFDLATAKLTMTNVKASLPVGDKLKKP